MNGVAPASLVIARVELARVLRRPLVPIGCALVALLAYQPMAYVGPGAKGLVSFGSLDHDAPVMLATLLARITVAATLFTALIFGEAGHRDRADGFRPMLLTTPVPVASVITGRYAAALLANLVIVAAAVAGAVAALALLDETHLGGAGWTALIPPLGLLVLPTVAASGALFLALALVGGMAPVIVCALLLVIGHAPAVALAVGESAAAQLGAWLDPFGLAAVARSTRFWTPAERNANVMPLDAALIVGRLLWLTLGTAALCAAGHFLRGTVDPSRSSGRLAVGRARPRPLRRLRRGPPLLRLELRRVVRHPATLLIGALAAVQVARNVSGAMAIDGTGSFPVTAFLVQSAANIDEFVIALTILSSSILVWRDHDVRVAPFLETSPLTGTVASAAKLAALFAAQVLLLGVAAAVTIALQIARQGIPDLDVYAITLGVIELPRYLGWAVLAILAQIVAPNRWGGLGLSTAGIILFEAVLPAAGLRSPLLLFGAVPPHTVSAMNGLAPYTESVIAFRLYWLAWCVPLFAAASRLWRRGLGQSVTVRWRAATRTHGTARFCIGAAVGLAASFAVWITVRDARSGQTRLGLTEFRAEYERRFGGFRAEPTARLVAVDVGVDFYPTQRRARIAGRYVLVNHHREELSHVDVFLFPILHARLSALEADRAASVGPTDRDFGHRRLTFATPLAPGDSVSLDWIVDVQPPRVAANVSADLAPSGSYLDNFVGGRYFPAVGYDVGMELEDPAARTSAQLAPRVETARAESAARESAVHPLIRYAAHVSTTQDQMVVAPGREVQSWVQDGRRHARYQADSILGSLAFVSGRYERQIRERSGTTIETYTHPGHDHNVATIVSGVAATLQLAPQLGGVNDRVLRIVEIPDYGHVGGTARAMSNMIVWNETGGWLSDYRAPGAFPYAFATAAHEAAHQWWPGQVQPARAPGSGLLGEGLPDLARLRAIERHLGAAATVTWMRAQSRQYFQARTRVSEQPLKVATNAFEYRQKSQFAFRWLSWAAGAQGVDRGVHDFTREFSGGAEHPVTEDLLRHMRRTLPESLATAVSDWFERRETWDLRVLSATASPGVDGYQVEAEVFVRRLTGATEPPVAAERTEAVELALYDGDGQQLVFVRTAVPQGRSTVRLRTPTRPERIVIDPQELMLDADHADDSRAVGSSASRG